MQNRGDSGRTGPWIGALKEEGGGLSWDPAARGEENPEPGLVAVPAVWAACHCLWGLSKQLCEDSGPLCAGVSKTSQHLSASEVHVTSGL